jgi:hypothetical protein
MQTQFANQLVQALPAERLNAYRARLAPTASNREILEAISWIEPAAQELVQLVDRFPIVHAQGTTQLDLVLQKFC